MSTAPLSSPSIYVLSPSGAVRDRAGLTRGVRRLQQAGWAVTLDAHARASHQRFAGDDASRMAAIGRAAASGADVVLITRGGYGLSRLLPHIDYAAVARSVGQGSRWVGMSDFTAFQLALLQQTGAISWSGPALIESFGGAEAADPITWACFEDLVLARGEGVGWRMPTLTKGQAPVTVAINDAPLWGGNLSMVCSLLGTPYLPLIDGGVLFLEEVGEHPYRIERMLLQLAHAGVLGRQRAVLIGQMTGFKLTAHDRGYNLTQVWAYLRSVVSVPIVLGLPCGHVPTKVVLPVGAQVDLQCSGRDALMVWGHLPLH